MTIAPRTQTLLLKDLFDLYGTDKGLHGYHQLYQNLIDRTEVRNVLEIGIGTLNPDATSTMVGFSKSYKPGASLRAWAEWFPNATILGIDNQEDTMFSGERITTKVCDSRNPESVASVIGDQKFDLIVDDGDHAWDSQVRTLQNLWSHVNPGGHYVIEDIRRSHLRHITSVVGKNWLNATIAPSRSCGRGFMIFAIPKGET